MATKTYSNLRCSFSFSYPAIWTVTEKPPAGASRMGCNLRLSFHAKGEKGHQVFLRLEEMGFAQAAEKEGFEGSDRGWVYGDISGRQTAEEIKGSNWKGLSVVYSVRCFGGSDGTYQGLGEGLRGFASTAGRTLVIDAGECQGTDDQAFGWVTKSLRFSTPSGQ